MSEDEAKRRQEIQRGLMVELWDLQSRATRLEEDLAAWKKRWLAAYQSLDTAMDEVRE